MGKPFKGELKKLSETIRWAEQQDVTRLARFLFAEMIQLKAGDIDELTAKINTRPRKKLGLSTPIGVLINYLL